MSQSKAPNPSLLSWCRGATHEQQIKLRNNNEVKNNEYLLWDFHIFLNKGNSIKGKTAMQITAAREHFGM